jgi:ATP-dependent helicase YprA (DUF1998 family)
LRRRTQRGREAYLSLTQRSSRSSSSGSRSRSDSKSSSRRRSSSSKSSRSSSPRKEVLPEDQIKVIAEGKKHDIKPILDFSDVDFPKAFFDVFKDLSFTKPTPIQSNAIPIALENMDVIGIAKTGSGKTLSFILPALMALEDEKKHYKKKGNVNPW